MDEPLDGRSRFRERRPQRRDVGEAIRTRREELGVSRRDLAARSGLSYPYVSELETGRKRGSPDTLRALAQALGMGQDELWARAEALAARAPGAQPPPRPAASAALQAGPAREAAPPRELARRVTDALAGADPAEAEAALLMALGELRYRQAAPPPRPGGPRAPDGRFEGR